MPLQPIAHHQGNQLATWPGSAGGSVDDADDVPAALLNNSAMVIFNLFKGDPCRLSPLRIVAADAGEKGIFSLEDDDKRREPTKVATVSSVTASPPTSGAILCLSDPTFFMTCNPPFGVMIVAG